VIGGGYYGAAPAYAAGPAYAYEQPAYGMQPWSDEWYAYCDDRYRSFDSRTGYFLGYDGEYHFCR
jgi:hypothetical protein